LHQIRPSHSKVSNGKLLRIAEAVFYRLDALPAESLSANFWISFPSCFQTAVVRGTYFTTGTNNEVSKTVVHGALEVKS